MTTHEQIISTHAFRTGLPAKPLSSWIRSIGGRVATWAVTYTDYYTAAALYEQLLHGGRNSTTAFGTQRTSVVRSMAHSPGNGQ